MLFRDPDRAEDSTTGGAATSGVSATSGPDSAAPLNAVPTSPVGPASPNPDGRRSRAPRAALVAAMSLVVVLAGGALFASGYALGVRSVDQPGTPATDDAAFQPFWDAYRAVVDRYAGGPVNKEDLIEGAIKGMVGALNDPYSTYLSPTDYQQALQDLSGSFEGIGAEIGTSKADGTATDCTTLGPDCLLTVITPIDGSPAQAAGLKAGDQVVAVDGSSLDGLTIDGARDRIRGKKGTAVVLTVIRGGGPRFDVSIVRDVIVQKEVTAKDLANGTIGYIRLTGFSENGVDDAIAALKTDVEAGEKGIILDLRGNPGGFVDAARRLASQFVKDGTLFWQEDSKGNQTPTAVLPDGVATDPSIKVAVLIDKGSASASEIVAGALQDLGRATLVGETSYGKGTVQQWTDLGTGGGGLKLTIAKWLTPNKRWIHHVGLTPDVPVTVPANLPAGADPVLDKAVEILAGSPSTSSAGDPLAKAA